MLNLFFLFETIRWLIWIQNLLLLLFEIILNTPSIIIIIISKLHIICIIFIVPLIWLFTLIIQTLLLSAITLISLITR